MSRSPVPALRRTYIALKDTGLRYSTRMIDVRARIDLKHSGDRLDLTLEETKRMVKRRRRDA